MNKTNRSIILAGSLFLAIAGISTGVGYAAWTYGESAENKVISINGSAGGWIFYPVDGGFFHIKNGTADFSDPFSGSKYGFTIKSGVATKGKNDSSDISAAFLPITDGGTTVISGISDFASNSDFFQHETKMVEVYIPTSYSKIGNYAFSECANLTKVSFFKASSYYSSAADAVSLSIGNGAFYDCSSITELSFPSVPLTIGSSALNGTGVSTLDLSKATSIGAFALGNCLSLTSVTLSDSLTSLGAYVFYSDALLNNVVIPSSITSIQESSFQSCSSLSSITFNGNITSLESASFSDCPALQSISLPSTLTSIGETAFAIYDGTVPLSIEFGGTKAQWDAVSKGTNWNYGRTVHMKYNLGSGTVVSSVMSDFTNSSVLSNYAGSTVECADGSVTVSDDGKSYSINVTVDPVKYNDWSQTGNNKLTAITIDTDSNTTTINKGVFMNNTNLTTVDLSGCNNLVIGDQAFKGDTALTSVTLPSSVSSIGSEVFYGCTKLSTLDVATTNDLSIGSSAFSGCPSLSSVSISSDGTLSLGSYAFFGNSTSPALKSVSLYGKNGITFGSQVFKNNTSLETLSISSPGNAITIPSETFYNDTKFTSIDLSSCSSLNIGNSAFAYCDSLTDIYLPKNVTLGRYNFTVRDASVSLNIHYAGTLSEWASACTLSSYQISNRSTVNVICSDGTKTISQ